MLSLGSERIDGAIKVQNKMNQEKKFIGPHVSASGGVENAVTNAHELGARAFALFTRNQRQWYPKPLEESSIQAFKDRCKEYGYAPKHILPHASYLINMGSPEEETRKKSCRAFLDEMHRCMQLGLPMLNFHPGSHLKKITPEECLKLIADGVNEALSQTEGVVAVIENTAGQGTNLGNRFEEIATLIELIDDKSRVGVCIDTAHTLSAGYEIRTREGYADTWRHFDEIIGKQYLRAIHLNDSKKELASRVDRHESIGFGTMSQLLFEMMMNDPRLNDLPIILETPDETRWAEEIRHLYTLVRSE